VPSYLYLESPYTEYFTVATVLLPRKPLYRVLLSMSAKEDSCVSMCCYCVATVLCSYCVAHVLLRVLFKNECLLPLHRMLLHFASEKCLLLLLVVEVLAELWCRV